METQETISKWAIETFGKPQDEEIILTRFMDEVQELDDKFSEGAENQAIIDECADVLIILYQVANTHGFDLHEAVNKKMQTNRARKWDTKGDGVGQHVEEEK